MTSIPIPWCYVLCHSIRSIYSSFHKVTKSYFNKIHINIILPYSSSSLKCTRLKNSPQLHRTWQKLRLANFFIPRWTTFFNSSQNCVCFTHGYHTQPPTHEIQHVGSSDNQVCRTIFGGPKASRSTFTDSVAQWQHRSPSDTTTTSAALHGAQCPSFSVTSSTDRCAHPPPGPPPAHRPFSFTFKYSVILSSPILQRVHNIVCSYLMTYLAIYLQVVSNLFVSRRPSSDFEARSKNCEKRLLAPSCLFVRPSVRMGQLGSHWADFN